MFDLSKNDDIIEILTEFGPSDLEISQIEPLKHGWKNFVYLVNNDLVVRFPKSNKVNLVREAKILDILNQKISIPIPKINYLHFDPSFITYDFIVGNTLGRDLLDHLNKSLVSDQLADFFAKIHELAFSADLLYGLDLEEYDYLQEIEDTLLETNFLISNVNSIIDFTQTHNLDLISREKLVDFILYWQEVSIAFLSDPNKETRLIHNDLHRKNILFNNDYKISGIIDFDEIKYGDLHLDFCNLVYSFDLDLVTEIMEKYTQITGQKLDFKKTFAMGVVYILSNLFRNFNDQTNPNFRESLELILFWIKRGY